MLKSVSSTILMSLMVDKLFWVQDIPKMFPFKGISVYACFWVATFKTVQENILSTFSFTFDHPTKIFFLFLFLPKQGGGEFYSKGCGDKRWHHLITTAIFWLLRTPRKVEEGVIQKAGAIKDDTLWLQLLSFDFSELQERWRRVLFKRLWR